MRQMNHRDIVFPEVEMYLKTIDTKGKKVMEIGHNNTVEFRDLFVKMGMEYSGFDLGNDSAKFLINKYFYGKMEKMDSFEDNQFDLVFSCHAFEHCLDPINALAEMKRVSKRHIMIITPHHCEHQILKGDKDHLFVLTEQQMERLFIFTGIKGDVIYTQRKGIKLEQDYNLISTGVVNEN